MTSGARPAPTAVAAGQLVSGIGLHDPQGLLRTRPDRLSLSSGTQPVRSSQLAGYRDNAFVPRAVPGVRRTAMRNGCSSPVSPPSALVAISH